MHAIAVAAACLACAGHGQRRKTSAGISGFSHEQQWEEAQSLADSREPQASGRTGALDPLKALAVLLLAVSSPAAGWQVGNLATSIPSSCHARCRGSGRKSAGSGQGCCYVGYPSDFVRLHRPVQMKHVTKANFEEAVEEIEKLLPSAQFVAFDEEMTGIHIPNAKDTPEMHDVPAERYSKLREVAMTYKIIQFGICLFHTEDGNSYVARPYNFYVFPESNVVTMEVDAVRFLKSHRMDFNKWIYEGIPYMNRIDALELQDSLFNSKPRQITLRNKRDVQDTELAFRLLSSWVRDESAKAQPKCTVITLDTPILWDYMLQRIDKDYPNLVPEPKPDPWVKGQRYKFIVTRSTEAERAEREAMLRIEKEKQYRSKVGFYRVFEALVDAKKPLVGHNIIYDLLFMLSHLNAPLPESYDEFKQSILNLFPTLFDTKYLVKCPIFKYKQRNNVDRFDATALNVIFTTFVKEAQLAKQMGRATVEVKFAKGFDRYVDGAVAHEAAYDAYTTGYSFAHMAKQALRWTDHFAHRTPIQRSPFNFMFVGDESRIDDSVYCHVRGLADHGVKTWADGRRILNDAFVAVKSVEPRGPLANKHKSVKKPVKLPVQQTVFIDLDNALVFFEASCAKELAKLIEQSSEGRWVPGLFLTPGEEWFAARTAKVSQRKRDPDLLDASEDPENWSERLLDLIGSVETP